MEKRKKILVIRFSSIGDVVLTTPVVRCLKQQLLDVEIHYLIKKNMSFLMDANLYVDKVWHWEQDPLALRHQLQQEGFDFIVDLQHNWRSKKVTNWLADVPHKHVNKLNIRKWLLVWFKINLMPSKSIVDRYLDTVKSLGVMDDGLGLDYFIPLEDKIKQEDLPASHWMGYNACVIGGSYGTKQLPKAQWVQLILSRSVPVVLLGGPEDKPLGDAIVEEVGTMAYNACGKFSFNESADIVRSAQHVYTNDTGLMHVAAAFQKSITVFWGNTVPSFGMYPYYGKQSDKSYKSISGSPWCQPCSKLGYAKCPLGHFKCMNSPI
jgi:ADP-heptose:LPS heptosyltransferase